MTSANQRAETDYTAVSLFAGVGGIDLALSRSGVRVTAAVEINDAARGVIADRRPETTLFTDVTEVTADELRATGFVPERGILTAGWPCQGNSVAGGRKGLADPRSGLWSHVVRLLDELRPAWFLGENVPGLLSVTGGEDFGRVLQDVADLGYGFAYRVLDAQNFGVPQRRRRVFIVGHLGDARGPVEVLLEPEGRSGHPPQSRQAGQDIAATLTRGSSGSGVSAPDRRQEDDVNLVIANCLTAREGKGPDSDATTTLIVQQPYTVSAAGSTEKQSHARATDVTRCLDTTGGYAAGQGGTVIAETRVVTAALTANGVGTCGADDNQAQANRLVAVGVTGTTAHTLTSEGADASEDGTGRGTPVIAFHMTQDPISGPVVPAMGAKSGGQGVQTSTGVRRLTPLECERLQGLPDNWTATSNGKTQADGPRYRQLGNCVAVPCVEWIARRIAATEHGHRFGCHDCTCADCYNAAMVG